MNYPIWELTRLGGGTLIAAIAIFHAFIAHFAVGGGMFIFTLDRMAWRHDDAALHRYLKKYTFFFVLLTMVAGGVTGVGIWFIIGLVQPAATSLLIHHFVFGWAIEWVFFVGEIVALLVYFYRFDRLNRTQRQTLAFLYFLFAWLSLFVINGILSFMLTPGAWLESGNFWHGIFNPGFWPSTVVRTCMAAMIAGMFGFFTAAWRAEAELRPRLMRMSASWLMLSTLIAIPFVYAYFLAIPEPVRGLAFHQNPETGMLVKMFFVTSVVIFLGAASLAVRARPQVQRWISGLLICVGLSWYGSFEYVRELARRPYIIRDVMYSHGLRVDDEDAVRQSGLLQQAIWVTSRDPKDVQAAGRELFNLQCLSCHTFNGVRNDVLPLLAGLTAEGVEAQLVGQGKLLKYMPPFWGLPQERRALAEHLVTCDAREDQPSLPAKGDVPAAQPPPFNPEKDEYVLLAFNDLGLHCVTTSDPWMMILPPANTLVAQLIRRGSVPEIVTENVTLQYEPPPHLAPPDHVSRFWDYDEILFQRDLEPNHGLQGLGVNGEFQQHEETLSFTAPGIPVMPYHQDGTFNPYPVFTVSARAQDTGQVLAQTSVVVPVSNEMGCARCHRGLGDVEPTPRGPHDPVAARILQVHDRINGTDLLVSARAGKPQLCAECHADPAVDRPGKPQHLSLSAAIHGWHAHYIEADDGTACAQCHPDHEDGRTHCFRGLHAELGLDCTPCHGSLQEHALSLLAGDQAQARANLLASQLSASEPETAIQPRKPWLQQPDCLNCHVDFEPPDGLPSAFNQWVSQPADLYRMRAGYAGIRCAACHGATHAIYPAANPYDADRDNLQPLQYTGQPYPLGTNQTCWVCHKQDMEFSVHHENMEGSFRNVVSR